MGCISIRRWTQKFRCPFGVSKFDPAPSFHRDGKVFRQDDGSIFPWAFGSEFAALRRYLDGVDLSAVWDQRYAAGQRGISVFLTSEIAGDELPGPYTYQQVLDALGPFADAMRARGFATEACVFQAVSVTIPRQNDQATFWFDVLSIAQLRPWMSVSWSKEWWKQRDFVDLTRFRTPFQTWDGGATCDGMPISPLVGTHQTFQPSRNDEWPRKSKSAWDVSEMTGQGCLAVECMGAAEISEPGRRSNVLEDHYWSAANARLLSMGSYFHSSAGIRCEPWGPKTQACAEATFRALSDIPLECQLGGYAKSSGGLAIDTYDELRTYGMYRHPSEQWVVVTRPGSSYPRNGDWIDPKAINGWHIVRAFGPMGTVLRCVR